MSAPDHPLTDGDWPLHRRALVELKCIVKRLIAPRGTPVDAPELPYLIVPVLGQSNAFGMGHGLDLDGLDRPHARVHQWAMCGPSKGKAVLAVEPLIHEIPGKGVGFGTTFAKHLADETGRAVLLIPGARGDTSFTPKNGYTWDHADTRTRVNLYRQGVAAVDAAIAAYPGSEVAVVLWHQGETDVPLTTGPTYQAKLDSLIHDLRARYGMGLPVLLGGMAPEEMELSGRDYPKIHAVHVDTPNRIPHTAFIPGARNSINSAADRHYNGAGMRQMGQDMWAQYREMCAQQLARYAPG